MGKIKVIVRDLGSVNFDKICRLALELDVVRQAPLDEIEVVSDGPIGPNDFDIEGDEADREYWKREGRSMTELYALRHALGTADASGVVMVESMIVPGLVALCRSLAENHGKVKGVKGGSLYKRGMVPTYARSLNLLPERATEIVGKLVKAVARSLHDPHPIPALIAAAGSDWDEIDAAVSAAERSVYEKSREVARALHEGRFQQGKTFSLSKSSGSPAPQGVQIVTSNPNLMKHLWASMKAMEPAFRVAVAVVSHPETGRTAVLCSQQYDLDIRPVAKALAKRFPEAEFDVNIERCSIVWDPRSKTPGPAAEQVREIVSSQLAFRAERAAPKGPRFGATLGDRFVQKRR